MRDATPAAIYLKDYQPPAYLVERTELEFELWEDHALVHAISCTIESDPIKPVNRVFRERIFIRIPGMDHQRKVTSRFSRHPESNE